jgi:hypothetical protein
MRVTLIALGLVALAARDEPPESKKPPTKPALAAITERGRALAGYDAAAWHASDAVQAKRPKAGSIVRYIAQKTPKGWLVAFGRLDEKGESFLIAYEARQGRKPDQFEVKECDPPKPDKGFFLKAAKAIDLAQKDFTDHFESEPRPYNVAVLPSGKTQLWVYLTPAPTKPGVWPLGGDARYLIDPEASKIVEKRQLHNAIIEHEAPPEATAEKAVASTHTHVLSDVPEDTDVFHVLTRKPAVPEVVVTKRYVFAIETGGSIQYLGTADKVLKK